LLCSDPRPKDFCLSETKWWGVCVSSVDGKRLRSLKLGEIKVSPKGEVGFSACSEYETLIAGSVAEKNHMRPETAEFWTEACQTSERGKSLAGYTVGNARYFMAVDQSGKFNLYRDPAPATKPADLCDLAKKVPIAMVDAKHPILLGVPGVKVDKGWSAELL